MIKENSKQLLPKLYQTGNKIVVKNALLIAIIVLINSCSSASNSKRQVEMTEEQNIKLDIATNSVVGLTTDGYVLGIEKQLIKAHERQDQVAEPIFNYFLVSGFELTNNLKKTQFKNNEDILKSSRKLQIIYNEYIRLNLPSYFEDKNGVIHYVHKKAGAKHLHEDGNTYTLLKNKYLTEKHERREKKAINSFNAYLTYLRTALIAGYLPSRINKGNYFIKKYDVINDYEFKIILHIPTNSQKFIGHDENNKALYIDGKGVQEITLRGYFDIKTRTRPNKKLGTLGINTKGMRFTDFSYKLQDFREQK